MLLVGLSLKKTKIMKKIETLEINHERARDSETSYNLFDAIDREAEYKACRLALYVELHNCLQQMDGYVQLLMKYRIFAKDLADIEDRVVASLEHWITNNIAKPEVSLLDEYLHLGRDYLPLALVSFGKSQDIMFQNRDAILSGTTDSNFEYISRAICALGSKESIVLAKAVKPKHISEYNILDPIKCDLTPNDNPSSLWGYCSLMAEDEEYQFYRYNTYKDKSGGYIIRKEKVSPNRCVFFGENLEFGCIYEGFLFITARMGNLGFYLYYIDRKNGCRHAINCYGTGSIWVGDVSYNQDEVKSMEIKGNKLELQIHRRRSMNKEPYSINDREVDYLVTVHKEGESFVAKRIIESPLERDETGQPVCPKARCFNSVCPKDCPIELNKLGSQKMDAGLYNEAIEYFTKSLSQERKYVDSMYKLGICYKNTEQYINAQAILSEAFALSHRRDISIELTEVMKMRYGANGGTRIIDILKKKQDN